MSPEIQQREVEGERILWSPCSSSADAVTAVCAALPQVSLVVCPLSSLAQYAANVLSSVLLAPRKRSS